MILILANMLNKSFAKNKAWLVLLPSKKVLQGES